jgi:septal ring factor EnvC (AmiA/AmiB activator)
MMALAENGRASLLMKTTSKRKRTRDELEEVKQEEEALKDDRHSFLQEVKRLKQEHAEMMEALQAIEAQRQLEEDQAAQQ